MLAEFGRFLFFVGWATTLLVLVLHAFGLRRFQRPRDHILLMVAATVAVAGHLMSGGKLRVPPPP